MKAGMAVGLALGALAGAVTAACVLDGQPRARRMVRKGRRALAAAFRGTCSCS